MSVFKPSVLQQFLEENGANARKSLSQNFLIDGNILDKIVASAQVDQKDTILEIGPGPGALTEKLLQTGAHVIAIEKDRLFADSLQRLQTSDQRLKCMEDDALEFPIECLESQTKIKIVANLPYNITTPLLTRFIPRSDRFLSLTIMVQKEVAQRICAHENTEHYGALTLFIRFFGTPKYCFNVSPNSFSPRPSVTSTVVHIDLHQENHHISVESFFRLTRQSFQQRRKMLSSSLQKLYSKTDIINALNVCNIRIDARPEQLSLNDFIRFFKNLPQQEYQREN